MRGRWGPGKVAMTLLIGGLVGIIISGPLQLSGLFVFSSVAAGLGALLLAVRIMFK
mgnify:CR=1 FL=1